MNKGYHNVKGSGFTGILAGISENTVKLITEVASAPNCPVGSSCTGYGLGGFSGYGFGYGYGREFNGSWFGAVTEIPIAHIASFTHNAI
ncbi:hypothetical protein AGMMS49975_24270 [Clostridia bacterium]|nr:hypothetical protein AGMMS49975_24270 [Clostridia bacterium]